MSKITAYAALAASALRGDDQLIVVDVHDTTMASTGTTKNITVTNLTGFVPPSGDMTGATDTAAINALTQAGKIALVQVGTYYTTNLTVDTYGGIIGMGPGTIFQAVAGTSGAMVAQKTAASTKKIVLRDFQLIPNTGTLVGVSLNTTGAVGDVQHQVLGVYVTNSGGDSFQLGANVRGCHIRDCSQYGSEGYGYNLAGSDNFIANCVSGASKQHGFYLADANDLVVGCKAFYAGYDTSGASWGTTQSGFYLSGSWVTLVNCSSQQNALHGYDLETAAYCTVTGCEADTNSAGTGVTTGVGINTNGCTSCAIIGNSGSNNGGLTPGAQAYGIQVAGTQNGTFFGMNTITGSSGLFNYVSGGGYTQVDSGTADFSQGLLRAGTQTQFRGGLDINVAGYGLAVAEGSNAKQGTATLVAGSKVVSNTSVTANSRILLTSQADGGTPGFLRVSTRTAGTSFTITSSSGSDTSTVAYEIFEPG